MITGAPLEISRTVTTWVAGEWIDDPQIHFRIAHVCCNDLRCWPGAGAGDIARRTGDRQHGRVGLRTGRAVRSRRGASSPSIEQQAGSPWSSGRFRSSCWKAARAFSWSRIRRRSKAWVRATRCVSRSSATAAATSSRASRTATESLASGLEVRILPCHTGEVPPKGAEGESPSRSAYYFQIMTFQKSSVRLSPSGPAGHLPRKTGEAGEGNSRQWQCLFARLRS